MKRLGFIKTVALGSTVLPSVFAQTNMGKRRMKIVVYSWGGNTMAFAERIAKSTGAEIFRLEPETPYTKNYGEVVSQAKRELDSLYKPPLKDIPDLSETDIVFLGTPNWWGTMSSPIRTFTAKNPLDGKIVVPFLTHKGSGWGQYRNDIKKVCPKASISEGLTLWGESPKDKSSQKTIDEWLRKIGFLK